MKFWCIFVLWLAATFAALGCGTQGTSKAELLQRNHELQTKLLEKTRQNDKYRQLYDVTGKYIWYLERMIESLRAELTEKTV